MKAYSLCIAYLDALNAGLQIEELLDTQDTSIALRINDI